MAKPAFSIKIASLSAFAAGKTRAELIVQEFLSIFDCPRVPLPDNHFRPRIFSPNIIVVRVLRIRDEKSAPGMTAICT
jgi:hypothetical protein